MAPTGETKHQPLPGAESLPETLMLFAIGPVQEFIAQARKTRDLWFGSHLLSELSKAAARKLGENNLNRVIFPYLPPDTPEKGFTDGSAKMSVANKVLAIVRTDNPKKTALEIRRVVTGEWRKYTDQAYETAKSFVNPGLWERQVSDLIEFYAVWTRMDRDDCQDYAAVLEETEQLLSARKTLRDFRPNEPGKRFGEIKSSLDGGRESVLFPDRKHEYLRYGIKINETLDAISLVKRLFGNPAEGRPQFRSVCDVAFAQFQHRIADDAEIRKQLASYYTTARSAIGALPAGHSAERSGSDWRTYDFRLFYPGRIEEAIEEAFVVPAGCSDADRLLEDRKKELIPALTQKLETLYKQIKVSPTPYYAFMLCDGDRIGQHLRTLRSAAEHRAFSERMSRFADKAGSVIGKYGGQLVYCGGDDIMAYLPLDTCLRASDALRRKFAKIMAADSAAEQFSDKATAQPSLPPPTLSIGIAIVHMLEPLGEVRRLAQEAERQAKERKNELAIHFHKRNGGDQMKVSLSFAYDPVRKIKKLTDLYRKKVFSSGFAYELRKICDEYANMSRRSSWIKEHPELVAQEVKRLAYKKKDSRISNEDIEAQLLPVLYEVLGVPGQPHEPAETNPLAKLEPLQRFDLLARLLVVAVTMEKVGHFR